MSRPFFWLHVKKSAGITIRKLLKPYYVEVDRVDQPQCFIQASPEEYNDILNNYRVVLGKYQLKRSLFAKKYLYHDQWEAMYSFAFSREPVDRCISMFYYTFWQKGNFLENIQRLLSRSIRSKKFLLNKYYAFDAFLDCVLTAQQNKSTFKPLGLHFMTHTAPMWDDITDFSGQGLLDQVFRLEELIPGINQVFEVCGIDKKISDTGIHLNRNKTKKIFTPKKDQINKILRIYPHDFDIYENAGKKKT